MIFLKLLLIKILPLLAASFFWSEANNDKKASSPDKPNILFILPDDLGWADVGYHGSDIKTPNIDQLARSGKILSQHYVMPTCTPTRVSLMTGKYPSRYGVLAPAYGEVIDLGDPTLASLLAENGYFTAIAGKWHMGSPPYTPLKYGFQSSYGYFDGQIDPYTHEYKTETELTERRSWHRNDEYLDGRNVWPQIAANQAPENPRRMYWKIRNTKAVREGDWKLLLHGNDDMELYNLKEDFRETRNLKDQHPEKVTELMKIMKDFQADDRISNN